MNLTEFRAAVLSRMGLPSGDSLFDTTALDLLINAALRQIETEGDWSWLEATETISLIDGTDAYDPAVDFVRTIALQIGTGAPLKRLPVKELLYQGGASGRPVYYGFRGDRLLLRPIPGAAEDGDPLVHTYLRAETELSSGTVPAVNEVHRVTVDATSGNWKYRFNGEETGNLAFNISASALTTALEALATIGAGNVQITGGPGNSGGTNPYDITFIGDLAGTNVVPSIVTNVSLAGGGATVTVSTIQAGVAAVGATLTPLLPEPFHQAVVEYAAYLGFRRSNNLEDAGAALAAFAGWIERMKGRGSRDSDTEGGGETPLEAVATEGAKAGKRGA